MPFFDPNEDQNSATGGVTPMRAPSGVEPERRAAPTLGEGFAASMRLENPMYSLFRSMYRNEIFPPDPDFNPEKMEGYKGSIYEQNYSDRFVVTRSEAEARSIIQQIDEEQADRKTREASGGAGVLFDIFAGVADPTIAMPGGAIYKSAKGGYSVAKSMASVAVAGASQMAVQETVLQNTQETRTALESTLNIASATILSGLLGAGAAAFLTRGESKALARALDADRRFIDAHYEGRPMPRPGDDVPPELRAKADELLAKVAKDNPEMTAEQIEAKAAEIWENVSGERVRVGDAETTGQAQAAGAAVSDTRALERVKIVPDSVREIPGVAYVADKLGAIMDRRGPLSRVLGSQSLAARRAAVDLAETPWRFEQNLEGVPTTNGPALDRLMQMEIKQARVAMSDEMDRLFSEYRFQRPDQTLPRVRAMFEDWTGRGNGFMTNAEFRQEVAKAASQGDRHPIPQVAEAAQWMRNNIFEPWKKRAIAAGLFPEDIGVTGAESYFMRIWNKPKIRARRNVFVDRVYNHLKRDQEVKAPAQERLQILSDQLAKSTGEEAAAIRAKIETELDAWEGASVSEVKSALRAREKYAQTSNRADDAPRLRAADNAVDRAVRNILDSNRALDDLELKAKAEEITDRTLSSPDGRLPYDIHEGGPDVGWKGSGEPPRGPLARRDFAIPDAEIREFLEDDAETVAAAYLRTIVPDIMLTERFGDVRMTEAFRKINEDYQKLSDAAKSEKEKKRIGDLRDRDIRDLAAMRDRIRGTYGFTENSLMRNAARYATGAKNFNVSTVMGMAGGNSLPDIGGIVMRYGFATSFRDGWMPWFKHLAQLGKGKNGESAWTQGKRQYRAMGIASEITLNSRRNALHDISDNYKPESRLERTLHHGANMMMIANMQAPLTDWTKTVTAITAGNEIFRAAKAVTDGTVTKKQLTALAESGIDTATARKIWEQFQTGGEIVDGVHLPNTADWTDDAARKAFEGAVSREADIAVVTPQQEKSLWLSDPTFLGVIGQFKSFIASATDRILIANLQRSDAATLQGMVFMIGLGMLTYKLNSLTGGSPVSDRPQDWLKEGISRSGIGGWFEEGNAMASKATGGAADIFRLIGADRPTSRFLSRNKLDAFLGPTAGKINNILQLSHAAGTANWSASDTRALRQLVAGQNLIWLRGVLNQVERSANDALGVENLPGR